MLKKEKKIKFRQMKYDNFYSLRHFNYIMSGRKIIDTTNNKKQDVVFVKIISKNDLTDIVDAIMRTLSIKYELLEEVITCPAIIFCDEEEQMDICRILFGQLYVPISKQIIDEYECLTKLINDAAKIMEMSPGNRQLGDVLEIYKSYLANLLNKNFVEKIKSIETIPYYPMLTVRYYVMGSEAKNEYDLTVMFIRYIIGKLCDRGGNSEFAHYKPIDDISRIRYGDTLKKWIDIYNTLVKENNA